MTPSRDAFAALVVRRALALTDWAGRADVDFNEWGGADFRFSPERPDGTATLRVVPDDGDWESGFSVHVFDRHDVLLASATMRAGSYSPDVVARLAGAMLDRES